MTFTFFLPTARPREMSNVTIYSLTSGFENLHTYKLQHTCTRQNTSCLWGKKKKRFAKYTCESWQINAEGTSSTSGRGNNKMNLNM